MKSEQLDISFEDAGQDLKIELSGNFYPEQIAGVREKIEALIEDGNRNYLIDLDGVVFRHGSIVEFFRELLNDINGRGGRMILIFRDPEIKTFFKGYNNIFESYPTVDDFQKSGFFRNLRRTGITYSRKTGIRLSTGMAVIFLVLGSGWLLTLFSILHEQNEEIRLAREYVTELRKDRQVLQRQVQELRRSVQPLQSLGLMDDSLQSADYDDVSDWVEYLETLEKRRRKREAQKSADQARTQGQGKPQP